MKATIQDLTFTLWEKGGRRRIYVAMPSTSKHRQANDAGYIDLVSGEIHNGGFGNGSYNIANMLDQRGITLEQVQAALSSAPAPRPVDETIQRLRTAGYNDGAAKTLAQAIRQGGLTIEQAEFGALDLRKLDAVNKRYGE